MNINISTINNGHVLTVSSPQQGSSSNFFSEWKDVLKVINSIQVTKAPEAGNQPELPKRN